MIQQRSALAIAVTSFLAVVGCTQEKETSSIKDGEVSNRQYFDIASHVKNSEFQFSKNSLALLLPAIQSARERARETVCKNNIHQINLAIAQFAEAHKKLPKPGTPGLTGGWIVEILPFIEQQNLHSTIVVGVPIADAPESLFRPPPIFRCPRRTVLDSTPDGKMTPGHYVFVSASGRESFLVFDAPIAFSVPWINGPEMDYTTVIKSVGPHSNGFFYANGFQQGVGFMLDGQINQ